MLMSPHPPEDMSSMFQFYSIIAATCVPILPDTAKVIPFIYIFSYKRTYSNTSNGLAENILEFCIKLISATMNL